MGRMTMPVFSKRRVILSLRNFCLFQNFKPTVSKHFRSLIELFAWLMLGHEPLILYQILLIYFTVHYLMKAAHFQSMMHIHKLAL